MVSTDDFPSHGVLRTSFNPQKTKHSAGKYVGGEVHTNSIESHWNILNRGTIGRCHKVSVEYLPSYLREFTSRFAHTRNRNEVYLWKAVARNGLD